MSGGVYRPRDHPVGVAEMDHHGAEIADIDHRVARHLPGNTFLLTHFIIGICINRQQFRTLGINYPGALKREPKGRGLLLHLFLIPEQGDVTDITEQHDLRRPKDPILSSFRQYNMLALLLSSPNKFVLEHERCDPSGTLNGFPLQQSLKIHVRFDDTENGGDLPFVLHRKRRPHVADAKCRCKGVHPRGKHGYRGGTQSLHQPLHLRRRVEVSGKHEACDARIVCRTVSSKGTDDDVRAVSRRDHEAAFLQMIEKIRQLHGANLEACRISLQPIDIPVDQLCIKGCGNFSYRWSFQKGIFRQ
ncbi:MAG: hypothetical protein A4E66_01975 [Syntrophus sp. PtaB.Bin001]|nr:MAG: hypothetical protein A4E66_01975 [Syntrophus sp. PtaB.Bin001]